MTENKMYSQRVKNIPVMRYCAYSCTYCAFQKFQKISNCQACRKGFNHTHLEVLARTPPKTKDGEFLTIGLSGDVSFMDFTDFAKVLLYCEDWYNRTFLIQSKNPEYFVQFKDTIPSNVILGTTIESNYNLFLNPTTDERIAYNMISKAPYPEKRYEAMVELTCRKAVTIEPVLRNLPDKLERWIYEIHPEFVYIGYCNDGKQGKRLKLPEPSLAKTLELIARLRESGIEVREKTIRKSWWEE